jgi:hypothetical protein
MRLPCMIRQYLSHICGEFLGIGETSEAVQRDIRDTKRALSASHSAKGVWCNNWSAVAVDLLLNMVEDLACVAEACGPSLFPFSFERLAFPIGL